jgi:hypothetical protein
MGVENQGESADAIVLSSVRRRTANMPLAFEKELAALEKAIVLLFWWLDERPGQVLFEARPQDAMPVGKPHRGLDGPTNTNRGAFE